MSLKYDNRYGLSFKKSHEEHTLTGSAWLHKDRQLDYVTIDYKLKYGDGVFGAAVNVDKPMEDDRAIDKVFSYTHKFGDSTYGAEVKISGDDHNIDKTLWVKYMDDGIGFKAEVNVCPEGTTKLKPKLFYKDD